MAVKNSFQLLFRLGAVLSPTRRRRRCQHHNITTRRVQFCWCSMKSWGTWNTTTRMTISPTTTSVSLFENCSTSCKHFCRSKPAPPTNCKSPRWTTMRSSMAAAAAAAAVLRRR